MNNLNISEALNFILTLQKNSCCDNDNCMEGCTSPFLGPVTTVVCYNTRPITLYSCNNGELWSMPYEVNDVVGTSTVFRIENVEGNCATFRVLAENPDTTSLNPYVATNSFFTMDCSCICAIRCLSDTYVECVC